MKNKDLQVGQTLWFVPNDHRKDAHELKIEGIGRKWIVTNDRHVQLSVATLRTKPDAYPNGQCYLSREIWEAEKHRQAEWDVIGQFTRGHLAVPADLPLEKIYQIQQLLGMRPDIIAFAITPDSNPGAELHEILSDVLGEPLTKGAREE